MKKLLSIIVVICFVSCVKYVAKFPGTYNKDSRTYTNEIVGIKLEIGEDWQLYTDPLNSDPGFKNHFSEVQAETFEALFFGQTKLERATMRCFIEKSEVSLKEYFKLCYEANKESLSTIKATYHESERDLVIWQYTMLRENYKFHFQEYVFDQGEYKIRLSLWTLKALYDDYKEKFEEIAKTVCIFDPDSEKKECFPIWQAVVDDKEGETIEYATSEKETDLSEKETDHCAGYDNAYLWKVSSPTNTVYLLGSVHYAKPEIYPLKEVIENSFKESDVVAVEIDATAEKYKEKYKDIITKAMLPKGETLKDKISDSLYTKLEEYLNKVGVGIESCQPFKPWFVTLLLIQIQLQAMGISPEYGIEAHFLSKARKEKEILELETFDEQMDLFVNFFNNELFLNYTLSSMEKTEKNIATLMKIWQCGNTEVMETMMFDEITAISENFSEIFDKLIYERNEKMSKKIIAYLKDKKNYFVIVGSGHLIGDKSIISYLKQAGFSAKQL